MPTATESRDNPVATAPDTTRLFEAWLTSTEDAVKASFELYNGGVAAAQKAILDALHAQARAVGRVAQR
jgi:hypothetical protein